MRKLTRRELIRLAGLTGAGALLAACAPAATPTAAPTAAPANTAAPAATTAPTQAPAAQPTDTPAPAATDTVAPTTAPTKAAPTKIYFIESWFAVPQFVDVINPVTKALSAKAQSEGLNVEFNSIVLDDHPNKYPVMYASGADFTAAFDAPWYKMNTLRDQKALVAVESLINDNGPKLKEEITDKIFTFNFDTGPDGNRHLYGIPTAYYYGGTTGVVLREDLRKKFNLPAPDASVGWSSFEPFLDGIAKNAKGVTPFANTANYSPVSLANYSQGFYTWSPLNEANISFVLKTFDKSEFKFVDGETVPGVEDRAKMLRSWWEKGWINKADLPLSGASETVEKDFLFPGKAASDMNNDAEVKAWQEFNKPMQQANPDAELKGYDLTGLSTGKWKGLGALKQWNFVVFNASSPQEKQVAAVQWWNWLASSTDNIDLWLMGIEGTSWKKEANNRFSEVAGVDQTTNYRRQWYVSGISGRFQRLAVDIIPEAEKIITANATESNWVFNPYEGFSVDRKPIESELTKIAAIATEAGHGLYTGQVTTDQAIAKFKKMLDDAGRQKVKEVVQKQMDDYIANFKA
jgi:putative aldouronate transport system substrate-binding protein